MLNEQLIGRKAEIEILNKALHSQSAEMVAVIGRRRVGKTFLIERIYEKDIAFRVSGIQHANMEQQIRNFHYQLSELSNGPIPLKEPKDWLEAFYMLTKLLQEQIHTSEQKKVVFLDEVPWMSTSRSGFLQGLSYFWNSWAVRQPIVVVICGSAASWMIQKIVNHRGGLHNRITRRIFLKPFNLAETKAYLLEKNCKFSNYQLVQLYMAMGGIPHYLKEIESGESSTQAINRICFTEQGLLQDEFSRLYQSLFSNAENHIAIIRTLATKQMGMTRKELSEKAKLGTGGSLKRTIEELIQSGFISIYHPFGKKKKGALYRLTDEYSAFYLQFIEPNTLSGKSVWHSLSQSHPYKSWSGFAFENICLRHIDQLQNALGISGIQSFVSSFHKKGTTEEDGAQIDLVLDRNDHTINLFEIKFYKDTFTLSKSNATLLRKKRQIFQTKTKTKKHLSWVLMTTFGITQNEHSLELIDKVLDIEILFKE